jgi:RNA polymerase sigma-70 factor (sigma-E family)
MTFDEYLRYRLGPLLRFATVVTCNPHLAEDVVQEVLARAHPRWNHLARLEQPDAYLKRMVVNEYLSWRRRAARVVAVDLSTLLAAAPSAPDHAVIISERADLIGRIAALTPKQRAVIALRYYDGRTDAEIAAVLGCGEGTVRSHASRALATLRLGMTQPSVPEGQS